MQLRTSKELLIGLITLLLIETILIAGCGQRKPMYIGRTTLIENKALFGPSVFKPASQLSEKRINTLVSIATSQSVLLSSVDTLRELGVRSSPNELSRCVTVEPAKDTNILVIEARSSNPVTAKLTADVIASELKKCLIEMRVSHLKQSHRQMKRKLLNAENDMAVAYTVLSNANANPKPVKDQIEVAKMVADIKASSALYTSVKMEYNKLGAEIKTAKSQPVMLTVDPAYVTRAR